MQTDCFVLACWWWQIPSWHHRCWGWGATTNIHRLRMLKELAAQLCFSISNTSFITVFSYGFLKSSSLYRISGSKSKTGFHLVVPSEKFASVFCHVIMIHFDHDILLVMAVEFVWNESLSTDVDQPFPFNTKLKTTISWI